MNTLRKIFCIFSIILGIMGLTTAYISRETEPILNVIVGSVLIIVLAPVIWPSKDWPPFPLP